MMNRSRYRTVKGKTLDFDKFRALHGSEISVGNMGVNARGDQVNVYGDIIKTRNEIMKEKYLDPKAKYNPIRSRGNQNKKVTEPVTTTEQTASPSPSSAPQVPEYVKPGVVDIRHRVLGQKGFDLRGSLANAVSVDISSPESPKPTTLTTLRRI